MATLVSPVPAPATRDDRFFMVTAIAMTLTIVAGFSLQLGAGRSSFDAPLLLHAHAVVFMGWVALYLLQNVFVSSGSMALHRRLGWIGAVWVVLMVVLGCLVTVAMVRRGAVPFFFQPLQFLVFDPLSLFGFAGLTFAAVAMRRRTDWHRRLHYCGMSMLLGPAFGRLLPMPLLPPWAFEATFAAVMIFPAIGVVADIRRRGSAHVAWAWGIGALVATLVLTEAITYSPIGTAIYETVVAGSPGAAVAPLDFPPPPGGPLITGR